jgi:hypothetical protein
MDEAGVGEKTATLAGGAPPSVGDPAVQLLAPGRLDRAIDRLFRRYHVDFPGSPRPPRAARIVLATVVAIAASLLADRGLVAAGVALFPSTRGFSHFRPANYASLTVLGVAAAGAAWALVARLSSRPRALLGRLAVVVTLVLWLPDLVILLAGENPEGVLVLAVMHLAIALLTYPSLVLLAPAPNLREEEVHGRPGEVGPWGPEELGWSRLVARPLAWGLALGLVVADLVFGAVAILLVPLHRPTALVPAHGTLVWGLHAALGVVLGLLSIVLALGARRLPDRLVRDARLAGTMGLVGIVVGGLGGLATIGQGLPRYLGMGVMLAGTLVAVLGYALPLTPEPARGKADEQAPSSLGGSEAIG